MKVGFIGCGNMGGALARAVASTGYAEVMLYDKDSLKAEALAEEISAVAVAASKVAECDYVFIGVKPNMVSTVLGELSAKFKDTSVIISMAAGVKIEKIKAAIARPEIGIIRIMPNTPVAYGEGMILYSVDGADAAEDGFKKIMEKAGTLDKIPEALIDAGSAVSGCGPAFVYMFIEALADGGVAAAAVGIETDMDFFRRIRPRLIQRLVQALRRDLVAEPHFIVNVAIQLDLPQLLSPAFFSFCPLRMIEMGSNLYKLKI